MLCTDNCLCRVYRFSPEKKRVEVYDIRECDSTLYVGLARAVPPTNTNFWLTFLLTRLEEDLYED